MTEIVAKELARLRDLVGRLEQRINELEGGPGLPHASPEPEAGPGGDAHGRRGLLRLASAGLAGAAVAAVGRPSAASAACGPPIYGSCTNTTTNTTYVSAGWAADLNRTVLDVRGPFNQSVATLAGRYRGVYGEGSLTGVTGLGYTTDGVGVEGSGGHTGVSASTDGFYGLHAQRKLTTTTPDATAAVLGEHLNTDTFGTGVIGSHAGAGWGMWAKSVSGIGIHADGGSGIGVEGVASGPAASSYGVRGVHEGAGCVAVVGDADNGLGVLGRGKGQGVQGLATGTPFSTSGVFGYISNTASAGAGVYGRTASTSDQGYGVLGSHSGSGTGVLGYCDGGTGVEGRTFATNPNSSGVVGRATNSAPATNTAGVSGATLALNNVGYGVQGTHAGTGIAVFGKSERGAGMRGVTNSTTTDGYGVHGIHSGTGTAVYGQTAQGVGVRGFGGTGRGGVFTGASAQVNLTPGALATHPTNGTKGDLYADSTGRLWFCKVGGSSATWAQVA
ncbi:hypothetical protein F0U44_02480 [Nocardioides humilatus]|uniref:Uncharacterized protein n=1 Tax=Nocardioides humilatus TaxID=2607660 RepID=A0A5B1LNL2_9ACTN|nr:hypothetical protein [Nocardioides humilatus]KAA1421197.1 hypothetical protein F0U44_02480 [Nocardioides humilatus]